MVKFRSDLDVYDDGISMVVYDCGQYQILERCFGTVVVKFLEKLHTKWLKSNNKNEISSVYHEYIFTVKLLI